jgi:hypothetical protein
MLNPTIIAATLGILIIGGLAAVDWYIWGLASKGRLQEQRIVRPLTMRELADKLLGGIAATNGEVLMVPPVVARTSASKTLAGAEKHDHDDHGFKKVA